MRCDICHCTIFSCQCPAGATNPLLDEPFIISPCWQTCLHQSAGLCPDCQAEYDEDPDAWIEFGHHIQGEINWRNEVAFALQWAADHPESLADDPNIPF